MLPQLSDTELEIMKIVWGNPEKITLFTYNKGFLSAKKIGRRNEYTTLISEEEYRTAQTKNFLDKIYEGSAKGLVSNLIMGDLLADEEYEELKRLLEKGKEKQ